MAPARPGGSADRASIAIGAVVLLVLGGLLAGLVAFVASSPAGGGPEPSAPGSPVVLGPRPAPPIELTDSDGRPFRLADLRGRPVLVFFGYTHCPDVCPVTIGALGKAIASLGDGARGVFVSIDPDRDTVAWLKEYVKYLPAGLTALTGTPAEIRATADAWGVEYARVETSTPGAYSMSHTADVFVVDATGTLREMLPFGTPPEEIAAAVRRVEAAASASSAPATPAPGTASPAATDTPVPATAAANGIAPELISTSIWAGEPSPIVVSLRRAGVILGDPSVRATFQLVGADGRPVGSVIEASAVRPPGVPRVSYVATLEVPSPGVWQLQVTTFDPAGGSSTSPVAINALERGSTAALGAPAPTVRTPTAADVGGNLRAITTDPQPDPRLYATSTADALASHTPFVLVIDSVKFRVSPACGKAVALAGFLAYRWPSVAFIHVEPYRYRVETDTAVLDGSIENPPIADLATAWGIGAGPWGATSVPWVFVVDGNGIVRAKFQGLVGSDEVDVVLSLIEGRTGG